MDSTARACRAIYYINLKENTCDTVYPDCEEEPRRETFDDMVSESFESGVIMQEHIELVKEFLAIDNIRKQLSDRDHMELQFQRKKMGKRVTSGVPLPLRLLRWKKESLPPLQ